MPRTPTRKSAADTERLHLQLDQRWVKALRREAADHRMSLRAVVERCIADRYDPERKQIGERAVAKELQRLQREMAQVRFSQEVALELFVCTSRNLMTRLPTAGPLNKAAGEAIYQALQTEVVQCLARDTPLLRRVMDTLQQQAEEAAAAKAEQREATAQ